MPGNRMRNRKKRFSLLLMALSFTLLALSACGDNNPAALVQNQHNVVSTASGMQPTTTLPVLAATAGQVLSATAASGAATTPVASTTHQDVALSLTPGLPAPALTLNPAPASSPLPINRVLQTVADIPLPGNSSRFDYQSLDPKTGRLFIAHLGDSRLVVFDTRSNQVVSTIENLGGIHGVLVVPELGRVFVTATAEHQAVLIDEASLKVITRLPAGDYPDGLAYDPSDHKLYISDEGGKAEPVIDTISNKALPSIPLGGEAGNTQYDPVSGHIFVDVQSQNELVEIDPKTDRIAAHYQLTGCQNDHSLQLDPAQHLAYITCDANATLLVLDMQQGMKQLSLQTVGASPDVLALDSDVNLLYVACESGSVSIFKVSRSGILKIGEGFVAADAHTIAVDPGTHRLYLPIPGAGDKPVLRIMELHLP